MWPAPRHDAGCKASPVDAAIAVRGVCFVEGFLLAVIDGAWQAQRAPSIPEGDRAIAGATKGTGAGPS